MQQPATKQSVSMFHCGEKHDSAEEPGNPCSTHDGDAFQAQQLDTDAAEAVTVLEQSSQGEVSTYSRNLQGEGGHLGVN